MQKVICLQLVWEMRHIFADLCMTVENLKMNLLNILKIKAVPEAP